MKLRRRIRLAFATLALAGIVSLPVPSLAQLSDPAAGNGAPAVSESIFGACMAIVCGASINVLKVQPHPAVIAAAVGSCIAAFLDAVFTPDNSNGG